MRHLTCDPQAETLGIHFLAFFQNLRDDQTRPIMEKYGLVNVQRDEWIATQVMMNALNDLAKDPDFSSGLVAIGIEIGKRIVFPPAIVDLDAALEAWDASYHAVHRGGEVGHKQAVKVDDRHYRIVLTDVYPDDFNYGIIYGFGGRFLPPGSDFTVFYDADVKPRDRGGEAGHTDIHIRW